MKETVLTPSEVGNLVPHWYTIDIEKISRVAQLPVTDIPQGKTLDTTPLLIDPEGYILNGRHRAVRTFFERLQQPTITIENPEDLLEIPPAYQGGVSVERLYASMKGKKIFILESQSRGIYTIKDLVRAYEIFLKYDVFGKRFK